jgi:hypothetical protein
MNIVNEIWKDIPDYEGFYQVSSLGRVRSVDRYSERTGIGKGSGVRFCKERILKPRLRNNYLAVNIHVLGKSIDENIHVFVARAFIGDRPDKHQVNHIDGNKLNNHADNLEYCSPSENSKHANAIGLCGRGENRHNAKLKNSEVIKIREMAKNGMGDIEISKIFNVSPACIWNIRKGKSYQTA